jgi:hypothetical protein
MSKLVLIVHKWASSHWILNYLIIAIPIALFTVMQIAPKQLRLVNSDGVLYLFPSIIFWVAVALSIVYPIIITWGDRLSDRRKNNGNILLKHVIESIDAVCNRKMLRFIDYVRENGKKNIVDPFDDITKPNIQINTLIDELNICLAKVFNMERNDIGISVIYKQQSDKKWNWLYMINLRNGTNITEVVGNANSSAKQIIDQKTNFVFFRDKSQGEKAKQYVSGKVDSDQDKIGSIICRNISVESDDNMYVNAVLSITTYGKYICTDEDESEVRKLLDYVLSPFDKRLKLELTLLYIRNCAESNAGKRVATGK